MTPTFTTGADLLGTWFAELERGEPPVRFRLLEPFEGLDIRPGRLILVGGAPGSGKTAGLLQVGVDLLRMNDSARLLVANVEMSPILLWGRIASRLSAVASLEPIAGRLAFLRDPYSLEHLAAAPPAPERRSKAKGA